MSHLMSPQHVHRQHEYTVVLESECLTLNPGFIIWGCVTLVNYLTALNLSTYL